MSDNENIYITKANCNMFTKNIVDNSIKSKNFVNKSASVGFINDAYLDKNSAILIATLTTKVELKAE